VPSSSAEEEGAMSPQWRRPRQTGGGWARAGKASSAPAEAGAEAPLVTGEHSMRGASGHGRRGWVGKEEVHMFYPHCRRRGWGRGWERRGLGCVQLDPCAERVGLERCEQEQA